MTTATMLPEINKLHDEMRGMFRAALAHVDAREAMARHVRACEGQLRAGKLHYSLASYRRVLLIAVGKAAIPMTDVAANILRPALTAATTLTGIAVSAAAGQGLPPEIRFLPGSHPVPDRFSRTAAEAVVDLLRDTDESDLVLFLLSGGASSLIELPADPAASVEETAEFYRALLYSGLPIASMNTLRKHASAVKGGRLAVLAARATQCSLLVSDVPGDALDVVGSGPSLPDPSTLADCRAVLQSPQGRAAFASARLQRFLERSLRETPKPGDAAFARANALCVLANADLVERASELASQAGYHAVVDNTCDDWDYRAAGEHLISRVLTLRRQYGRVCLLSGGEVTVAVPESAGMGGRNQHFALYAAMRLAGTSPPIALLSAGSDGVDGNSPAAGALADSFTVQRAERLGLQAAEALERFSSYSFFHALGNTVVTGPTGNNVRDLRMFLTL